ncbi:MAG: sensor histidine kinase, partial [Rhodomicrobium sp.]|nr:sensor histidine kinase [Rhodomicrobium sp.]
MTRGAAHTDHDLAGLAHDLRNLLSPALLAAERLAAHEDTAVVLTANRIMLAIERTVLLLNTHIANETQAQVKAPRALPVPALIAASARAALAGTEVRFETDLRIGSERTNQPLSLFRVLFNLIRNAAQAADGGRGSTVTVSAALDAASLLIDIGDDGPGLPAPVRNWLHPSLSEERPTPSAVGLGIPTAVTLLKQMGGSLVLLRTGSKGTCFRVVLPPSVLEARSRTGRRARS